MAMKSDQGLSETAIRKEIHMSILHIHKLFTSSQDGWHEIAQTQPSALKLFALLVVPFSLTPPLMLEYAGRHVGAFLFPNTLPLAWSLAALFFLLAELATVPLMSWAIKSVARSKGVASSDREAFAMAAIAPVPLWLSSLVLFYDQVFVIMAGIALGLAGSVVLIFRGVQRILKVEETLVALDIAYTVTALGLIAWVLLVMLGLVPALAR
jgi:hypothetical protein